MPGYRNLEVYRLSYELALDIFALVKRFPASERFSLSDQILRSSRGVVANLVEGYRKRQYPRQFAAKCADADGEACETQLWLDFARDFGYLDADPHASFTERYERVGRLLGAMIAAPDKYAPRSHPPGRR